MSITKGTTTERSCELFKPVGAMLIMKIIFVTSNQMMKSTTKESSIKHSFRQDTLQPNMLQNERRSNPTKKESEFAIGNKSQYTTS